LEVSLLFLFFLSMYRVDERYVTVGEFDAIYVVLLSFVWTLIRLGQSIVVGLESHPPLESVSPILEASVGRATRKSDPGALHGELRVENVSFAYEERNQTVLRNVNLHAAPGEFIAVIGPSGAGKSTLLRLLLGMEEPQSGKIFYDGQDLANLNLAMLRKQFGVVLQNAALFPGTILDNIIGSSLLSFDDAMQAAQLSGLEEDLASWPMGLHTLVGEGAGLLSGGQKQRILIARALVRKPRILFFDEATSALDNKAQAHVANSIGKLGITRVIIAHRKSSVAQADRTYELRGQKDMILNVRSIGLRSGEL